MDDKARAVLRVRLASAAMGVLVAAMLLLTAASNLKIEALFTAGAAVFGIAVLLMLTWLLFSIFGFAQFSLKFMVFVSIAAGILGSCIASKNRIAMTIGAIGAFLLPFIVAATLLIRGESRYSKALSENEGKPAESKDSE